MKSPIHLYPMRLLALSISVFALTLCTGIAGASAESARTYETQGTLNRSEDGQIAQNIWAGTSRSEALELIRAIPQRFSSPIYFELARRLLLSDAPAFAPEKTQSKTEDGKPAAAEPDILIKRIDKLLEIGALRDAQTLYDAVVTDVPDSFNLAYRNLLMLMLRGQLSAACLDVQAMQPQHGSAFGVRPGRRGQRCSLAGVESLLPHPVHNGCRAGAADSRSQV